MQRFGSPFRPDQDKEWTFPDYVTSARIENSELVLETR
jgi:hypothetical protein